MAALFCSLGSEVSASQAAGVKGQNLGLLADVCVSTAWRLDIRGPRDLPAHPSLPQSQLSSSRGLLPEFRLCPNFLFLKKIIFREKH